MSALPLPENSEPRPRSIQEIMQDPIWTVDELAVVIKLSRSTTYERVRAGQIPGCRRVGDGAIRVHRDTVLAWLADGSSVLRPGGKHGRKT